MRVDQAKALLLWDVLASLGYQPEHELRGEFWYRSPLRQEQDASFKLTKDGKAWYDHGVGEGGNILDFICRYYQLKSGDIRSALQALDRLSLRPDRQTEQDVAARQQAFSWPAAAQAEGHRTKAAPGTMTLHHLLPLCNWRLKRYLEQRGIPPRLAKPYVQEMHYSYDGNSYFALAFQSDSGGYELRNQYFKGCYGAKDITTLTSTDDSNAVAIFEGFMDFLSAIAYTGRAPAMPVIVMNSVAMRQRTFEAVEKLGVACLHLYLDDDAVGRSLTAAFRKQFPGRQVNDESDLYKGHKDFNAFLMSRAPATTLAR